MAVGIADGDPVPGIEAGRFLVADRIPRGSLFHKSVVLILEHGLTIACARAPSSISLLPSCIVISHLLRTSAHVHGSESYHNQTHITCGSVHAELCIYS